MGDVIHKDGRVIFTHPVPADIEALIREMRPQDAAEVTAATSADIPWVLDQALKVSRWTMTATDVYGCTLCVFGIAPRDLLGDEAAPWMLGTVHLRRYHQILARFGRAYMDKGLDHYPRLINYVDARNAESIVWLRRMGFIIDPPEKYGVQGLPFHRFHKEASNV